MIRLFVFITLFTYTLAGIFLISGAIAVYNDNANLTRTLIETCMILILAGLSSAVCGGVVVTVFNSYRQWKAKQHDKT